MMFIIVWKIRCSLFPTKIYWLGKVGCLSAMLSAILARADGREHGTVWGICHSFRIGQQNPYFKTNT